MTVSFHRYNHRTSLNIVVFRFILLRIHFRSKGSEKSRATVKRRNGLELCSLTSVSRTSKYPRSKSYAIDIHGRRVLPRSEPDVLFTLRYDNRAESNFVSFPRRLLEVRCEVFRRASTSEIVNSSGILGEVRGSRGKVFSPDRKFIFHG